MQWIELDGPNRGRIWWPDFLVAPFIISIQIGRCCRIVHCPPFDCCGPSIMDTSKCCGRLTRCPWPNYVGCSDRPLFIMFVYFNRIHVHRHCCVERNSYRDRGNIFSFNKIIYFYQDLIFIDWTNFCWISMIIILVSNSANDLYIYYFQHGIRIK